MSVVRRLIVVIEQDDYRCTRNSYHARVVDFDTFERLASSDHSAETPWDAADDAMHNLSLEGSPHE